MYTGSAVLTVVMNGIKLLFGMFWKDLQLFVQHVRIGTLITCVTFFSHRFNFPLGGGIICMYTCALWTLVSMHIYQGGILLTIQKMLPNAIYRPRK